MCAPNLDMRGEASLREALTYILECTTDYVGRPIQCGLQCTSKGNSQRGSRRVQQRWEPLSAIHLSSHYRVPNKLYLHASEQASNSANIPLHLGVTGCKTQGASVVFRGKPVAGRVDHFLCAFLFCGRGRPRTFPWVSVDMSVGTTVSPSLIMDVYRSAHVGPMDARGHCHEPPRTYDPGACMPVVMSACIPAETHGHSGGNPRSSNSSPPVYFSLHLTHPILTPVPCPDPYGR